MVTGAAIVSTLVLGITILIQGKAGLLTTIKRGDLLRASLLGIANPFLYYLLLFKAYSLLPAQIAQPLNMVWPIIMVLISIPVLKQKIGLLSILSMIVSFSGVVVLSLQGGTIFTEGSNLNGVLLALSTAIIWAFYWIYNMKNRLDEVVGLFLIFGFSTVYLLVVSVFRTDTFPSGREAWLTSAYIGIFEMGLAFVFWFKALQLSSTTAKISNLVFISPFLSLLFVRQILGETIYISTIFGIILVVTGIVIQSTTNKNNVTT
jgi:drug/metabolite transporter (DMT)-like permease